MSLNEATAPVTAPSGPTMAWALIRTHIGRPVACAAARARPRPTAGPGAGSTSTDGPRRRSVSPVGVEHLEPSARAAAMRSSMRRPRSRTRGASNMTSKASLTRTTVPSASTIITPSASDSMMRGLATVDIARPAARGCLLLGDVADVDHDPADRVVEMVGRHHLEVDRPPVGPDRAHLEGDRQPAPGHQVVEEGAHRVRRSPSRTARRRPSPTTLLTSYPNSALGRGADEDEPTVRRRSRPPRRSRAPRASGTAARRSDADPLPGRPVRRPGPSRRRHRDRSGPDAAGSPSSAAAGVRERLEARRRRRGVRLS